MRKNYLSCFVCSISLLDLNIGQLCLFPPDNLENCNYYLLLKLIVIIISPLTFISVKASVLSQM